MWLASVTYACHHRSLNATTTSEFVMLRSHVRHSLLAAALLAILLSAIPGATVLAVNDLTDGIAPGIVDDLGDFGTSSPVVPQNGYVTYMAQGAGNLGGTPVEIWKNTGGDWVKATTRAFAEDGSIRYSARITGKTSFQARIPGTPGGSAHGRTATTWSSATDRRTKITVGCGDWEQGDSNILISRTAALKSGTVLVVTLCSNASTGASWDDAAIDSAHIRVLGHSYTQPTQTNPPIAGADGLETWSFLVTGHGEGHAVLSYGQPFAGGFKAAWIFVLETRD
jgi:predicted secreted protein